MSKNVIAIKLITFLIELKTLHKNKIFRDTKTFFNLKHNSHQYLFIANNQVGMWVLTDFLSPAYDLVSRTRCPCFRNKQKTEQILNLKMRAVVCLQLCYIISAFTALRKDVFNFT